MKSALITILLFICCLTTPAAKPERPFGHEQIPGWATNIFESLEYGVLLEMEGSAAKIGGENESDIVVATVAFDLEAAMNDWLWGHVGLLWEQDSREDDNVDEAYIGLGASDSIPFYFIVGRFYQPVGNFESVFISDPLTLELMEMNKTAGMLGADFGWFDVNIGAFQGDTDGYEINSAGETNAVGDSTVSDWFSSVTFIPVEPFKIGAYWLSDLMETYNYGQVGETLSVSPGYETVGGAGIFANLYLGRFSFGAEYASAVEDYLLGGGRYRPAAFHLEGAVQVHDKVAVGLKYETSDDLYAAYDRSLFKFGDKFPGQAYGAVIAYDFHENAAFAAEYMHLDELDDDARGDVFTVQLGLFF